MEKIGYPKYVFHSRNVHWLAIIACTLGIIVSIAVHVLSHNQNHPNVSSIPWPCLTVFEIDNPGAIAVDPMGFIYVADNSGKRIQKFGPHGEFIAKLQWDTGNDRRPLNPCWQNPWNTCD